MMRINKNPFKVLAPRAYCTASLQTLEALAGIIIIPETTLVCRNVVIYNEKYVFGLPPHFWHGAPKILGIS